MLVYLYFFKKAFKTLMDAFILRTFRVEKKIIRHDLLVCIHNTRV